MFDYIAYMNSLGKELVLQFDRANLSTQNVAKGENRESSVVKKLIEILPSGIGIGSGFVFDIDGNVSNQCDIIVYEKDFAMICEINNDDRNRYYNIESVIALGEVKTNLDKAKFNDCCKKFGNFINIKRYTHESDIDSFRAYLSKVSATNFNKLPVPRAKYDRPMKFIISQKSTVLFNSIAEYVQQIDNIEKVFNLIFDLEGRFIFFTNNSKHTFDQRYADCINECKNNDNAFVDFISMLITYINYGTTVPLNYTSYLLKRTGNFENCRCIGIKSIEQK